MSRAPGRPAQRLVLASLLFLVFVLLALVVQRSLLARLPLAQPDLVALVVAAGALARGPRVGAVWGLAAGVLADLAPPAGGVAGLWAFAYASGGFVVGLLAQAERPGARHPFRRTPGERGRVRSRSVHGLAAAVAAVTATVLHLVAGSLLGRAGDVGNVGDVALARVLGAVDVFVLGWLFGRPLTRLLAPRAGDGW